MYPQELMCMWCGCICLSFTSAGWFVSRQRTHLSSLVEDIEILSILQLPNSENSVPFFLPKPPSKRGVVNFYLFIYQHYRKILIINYCNVFASAFTAGTPRSEKTPINSHRQTMQWSFVAELMLVRKRSRNPIKNRLYSRNASPSWLSTP